MPELHSPAFEDGGQIPRKHGYKESNTPIPLELRDIPQECESLALVMDDPDAMAAVGKVWVHWTVWNIPPDTAKLDGASLPDGCIQGKTDFGKTGYGGPAPPDKRHTYVFRLYALDSKLKLPAGSDKAKLDDAMRGHILGDAVLRGTYDP